MRRPTVPLDELLAELFDGDHSALAAEIGPRLAASRRYRAFVDTYRDKIRHKARGLRNDDSRRDIAFELTIASHLVEERRFAVEYEPYGIDQRAPDFRVTFRNRHFNVEVRRLRSLALAPGAPVDPGRLTRAICDKLGQLPPGIANVLVLGAVTSSPVADALTPAMLWLQERSARKDDEAFVRRGFAGARDFSRHYQRLSAVLWVADERDTSHAELWRNPQARHRLPDDVARAITNAMR